MKKFKIRLLLFIFFFYQAHIGNSQSIKSVPSYTRFLENNQTFSGNNTFSNRITVNGITNNGSSYFSGSIGFGSAVVAGEMFHIGDGNMLLEGGGEVAQKFKRDFTTTGTNLGVPTGSGTSVNPIFQVGRIIQAGDGDPEIRFMYSDDNTAEKTVFEVDRKGIVASVKTSIGSHFEGFASLTDVNPMFRLNSYPRMRLEMGAGGNNITDVAIERTTSGGLGLFTNNLERITVSQTGNLGIGTTTPNDKLDVSGNLSLNTAGNKIKIATGTNASIGTATLVAGTITVVTTAVTSNSKIILSYNTPIGTLASGLSAPSGDIINSTSFVIKSLTTAGAVMTLDLSTVNWWIIN